MKRSSKSVRLVSDEGVVITVDPDLDGNGEPVELQVAVPGDHGTTEVVRASLDGETADALVDAIDEARGRRRRQRRGNDSEQDDGSRRPSTVVSV
jgi:hypothetical protein